jgi:hypothetical protein
MADFKAAWERNNKKTAPVRTRVCEVGGGFQRPTGSWETHTTAISNNLANCGTSKFLFMRIFDC